MQLWFCAFCLRYLLPVPSALYRLCSLPLYARTLYSRRRAIYLVRLYRLYAAPPRTMLFPPTVRSPLLQHRRGH